MLPRYSDLLLQIIHQDPALPEPAAFAGFSPEDWQAFTAEAIRFRLAFQVLSFLKKDQPQAPTVPEECISFLRQAVRFNLMQNLRQQGHLRKMLAACAAEDIPVILLKGLWLSEMVYRDQKARQTGDIDLLLKLEDMPRFTALVRRLGFSIPPETDNIAWNASSSNELSLTHPTDGSSFDIHWALTRPDVELPIDERKMWQRSKVFSVSGVPTRSLCVEDQLLYLCFHAAEHHLFEYVGPRALLDIALLVSSPPDIMDWNDVINRAFELGWARSVWIMLVLAERNLGTEPPFGVLDALNPKSDQDQALPPLALEALLLTQRRRGRLSDNVVRVIDEPSWPKKISFAIGRTFPSWQEVQKNSGGHPAGWRLLKLYVSRWKRLAQEHGPGLVKAATGDSYQTAELARNKVLGTWLKDDRTKNL